MKLSTEHLPVFIALRAHSITSQELHPESSPKPGPYLRGGKIIQKESFGTTFESLVYMCNMKIKLTMCGMEKFELSHIFQRAKSSLTETKVSSKPER